MIKKATIESAMYQAIRKAVTLMPDDVKQFLEKVIKEETDSLAIKHLELTLENVRLAAEGKGLICGDTGYPLYFVKVGKDVEVEGGFTSLYKAAEVATEQATAESFLRPTMVDPITRDNPGNNIGFHMPKVDIIFDDSVEGIEIVAVPKGGGSEIFGTFYKMMYPSDGIQGILKFVIESVCQGCYAGKICPPAVVGVGIGGTADICMNIAKKAAVLTPLGSHNPDPAIAELEVKLLDALRKTGLGPMGSKGINAVLSLHIATAVTHTAALPVAVNAQCSICRRWKVKISADEKMIFTGDLNG